MTQLYRHQTNYPELYQNVYWGNFKHRDDHDMSEIYNNRNRFVEDFEITRRLYITDIPMDVSNMISHWWYGRWQAFMDHMEVYQNQSGQCIVVVSPYDHITNQGIEALYGFMEATQFKMIYPIYQINAISMIRIFDA